MAFLIGIDVGTRQLKSGLFDHEGRLVAAASSSYPTSWPHSGWAEQDPSRWWDACSRSLRKLVSGVRLNTIDGLCIVGQSPTLVCVNDKGDPTRPAILWADRRTMEAELGSGIEQKTHFSPLVAKAAWVQRHDRDAYRRTRWFFGVFDYLTFKMCAESVTVEAIPGWLTWPEKEISAAGLDSAKMPYRTCKMGEHVGKLSSAAALTTGLLPGVPVIAGTVDSFSAWIGTATLEKGVACCDCGTTAGVALCWNCRLTDPKNRVQSIPHPAGKSWIVGGAMSTGTNVVDWFKDTFYPEAGGIDGMLEEASKVSPGAEGLVSLPYIAGERAPIYDADARAVFFGIDSHHTRAHFVRAVLEGVAFAVYDTCLIIKECGGEIQEARLAGGGARSSLWNQIKADVLGTNVLVPELLESALLGSSVIAATSVGMYSNLHEAAKKMVKIKHWIEPNQANHQRYSELFDIYRDVYVNLQKSFSKLSELRTRN